MVANALLSALIAIFLAADAGRQVFLWLAALFHRAPRIVPTVATLAFAVALSGAAIIVTLRTTTIFGWHAWRWFPYGPVPGTGENGKPAVPEGGQLVVPHHESWSFTLGGGATFHLYDVLAVCCAVLGLIVVTVRFRLGRRGLLSRATAANLERAATLGVDVVKESKEPWRIAGALSGLAGVLAVSLGQSAPVDRSRHAGADLGARGRRAGPDDQPRVGTGRVHRAGRPRPGDVLELPVARAVPRRRWW